MIGLSSLTAWAVGRPAAGSGLSGSQGPSPLTAVGLDSSARAGVLESITLSFWEIGSLILPISSHKFRALESASYSTLLT